MKIVGISVARIRNLGNYENRKIEMNAELADGEDAMRCMRKLIALVDKAQGIKVRKIKVEERD